VHWVTTIQSESERLPSVLAHTQESFLVNQKLGVAILVFEMNVLCLPQLPLFDQKYSNTINSVKLLFYIVIYSKMSFIPVMSMLNFQNHYSSLQCHMILQKSF